MVTVLAGGYRKARKPRQCFHCYRQIPAGEVYGYQTCKYDDVYTLSWHQDCDAAMNHYSKFHAISLWDYDEGYPPLADMISDGGEFEIDCNILRGHFPHVVARLELADQKAAIRLGEWVPSA